jgi:hypothetical protein
MKTDATHGTRKRTRLIWLKINPMVDSSTHVNGMVSQHF